FKVVSAAFTHPQESGKRLRVGVRRRDNEDGQLLERLPRGCPTQVAAAAIEADGVEIPGALIGWLVGQLILADMPFGARGIWPEVQRVAFPNGGLSQGFASLSQVGGIEPEHESCGDWQAPVRPFLDGRRPVRPTAFA